MRVALPRVQTLVPTTTEAIALTRIKPSIERSDRSTRFLFQAAVRRRAVVRQQEQAERDRRHVIVVNSYQVSIL